MFTLKIETDNEAFHGDDGTETSPAREEIARILRELADRLSDVEREFHSCPLSDSNGLKVGRATLALDWRD